MKSCSEIALEQIYARLPNDRHNCRFYCTPLALGLLLNAKDTRGNAVFMPSGILDPIGRLHGYLLSVHQEANAPDFGLSFAPTTSGIEWADISAP